MKIASKILFLIFFLIVMGIILIGKSKSKLEKTSPPSAIDIERPADVSPDEWELVLLAHEYEVSNNAEIDFYGKVIDQDGQPVADATVVVETTAYVESLQKQFHAPGGLRERTIHRLKSEKTGVVSLTGQKGQVLHIRDVTKDNYISPAENKLSLMYANDSRDAVLPSRTEPMIFTLRHKTAGYVALKPQEISFKTTTDNTESQIDLLEDKVGSVKTADISLRLWADEFVPGRHYDWSVTLNCNSGGIVAADDNDGLYEAPTVGYTPSVVWRMKANTADYSTGINRKIYLKCRDGSAYAAAMVTVYCGHDGTALVVFRYVINPNGSRILEHEERL